MEQSKMKKYCLTEKKQKIVMSFVVSSDHISFP